MCPRHEFCFFCRIGRTHSLYSNRFKDPKNDWLQIFNVSTKSWSLKKFEPKYEGKILNPPTNQPVAVDSRLFWYDAVKQWVIGYNPFSGESYLAVVNTHDHGTSDSQPRLAFISDGDGGSLYCCIQWLSPATINANPMNKFHCLKFLLACSQTSSGLTTFLDCKVVACQMFLIQVESHFWTQWSGMILHLSSLI